MEETNFDPNRRLCPDGSCVGVIDAEGHCSICGPGQAVSALHADEPPAPAVGAGNVDGAGGGFNPGRRLCDDGSCVGIVGPDRVCGVCGRRAG